MEQKTHVYRTSDRSREIEQITCLLLRYALINPHVHEENDSFEAGHILVSLFFLLFALYEVQL